MARKVMLAIYIKVTTQPEFQGRKIRSFSFFPGELNSNRNIDYPDNNYYGERNIIMELITIHIKQSYVANNFEKRIVGWKKYSESQKFSKYAF